MPERGGPASVSISILLAAAALLVALAALRPPELHPWSQAVCQALAAVLIVVPASGRSGLQVRPPGWLALAAAFGLAAVVQAACTARALDEAFYALTLLAAGLAGRAVADHPRGPATVGMVLAMVGVAAAAHAAAQRYFVYPALAASVRSIDPADPTGVLVRLEAGRPSGPFLLPAALGGFLALALPWTVLRALRGRGRRARLLAAAAGVAIGSGIVWTRSLGALAATGFALLVLLPALAGRRRLVAAAAIVLVVVSGAFWFARQRHDMRAAPGGDPLTLRAGNWSAALRMIADHPVLGVGPGSFPTFYPRYMRPGMNESRHAHNSFLEVAAGWGAWCLVPLALLAVAWGRAVRDRLPRGGPGRPPRGDPDDRLALLAAGGSFLAHNLGDFTLFLPGVAFPAVVVLGCGLGAPAPGGRTRRIPVPGRAAAAVVAILLVGHGLAAALSRHRLEEAVRAAERGETVTAIALARGAREARPDHPDPHAFLAQAILANPDDDPRLRAEGESEAGTALRIDPEAAILHWTMAHYHEAAGRPAAAWRERYAAHRLYPLKDLYRPRQDPGAGRAPAGSMGTRR